MHSSAFIIFVHFLSNGILNPHFEIHIPIGLKLDTILLDITWLKEFPPKLQRVEVSLVYFNSKSKYVVSVVLDY